MEHDTSDILGHKTMPVVKQHQRASFFPFSITGALFTSFLLYGIYLVGNKLRRRFLQWREQSYKLATRRRHGIPDSDLRPFNVAYADAMNRAREEENRKAKPRPAALRPNLTAPVQHEPQVEQSLRQRQGVPQRSDPGMRSTVVPVPGRYTTTPFEPRIPAAETSAASDSNHHSRQNNFPHINGFVQRSGINREGGLYDISDVENVSDGEGKKRALDAEADEEHEAKKTRVEGDDLIDGDEDAEFEDMSPPKRGSKRGIQDEADSEEPSPFKKSRGKRARKVSEGKHQPVDDNMDVDDEEADQVAELKSTATRGKKRDRTEAGSTFGGDDEDSAAEDDELEGDSKPRRHRKRRTVAKRKSEATYFRGKQRSKDGLQDDVSDASSGSGRGSPDRRAARKSRKSRRHSHLDRRDRERRDDKSDVSMDESTVSTRSKVRSIGDEWESNGVKYKIGPNGQRLRQALVKKARHKFVMPKDSQHPDRDVNLQVYVESWLTEEEYAEAKAQHLLAWQDPLPETPTQENGKLSLNITQSNIASPQGLPAAAGKNLLWSQSTSSTPTMSPASQSPVAAETPSEFGRQRSFRHSLAGTPVGLPLSASVSSFAQSQLNSQVPTVKRIASNARATSLSGGSPVPAGPGSPGLSDSTNVATSKAAGTKTPHKVFSKWEKQELEAQAMMKIREATKKKEMEKEAKLKEAAAEKLRLEKEKLEKERLDKEKAEKERQAKEKEAAEKAKAASATSGTTPAPPQITVTAPSGGPSVPNGFFTQPAAAAAKTDASSPFSFKPAASSTPTTATNGTAAATPAAQPPSTSSFSFGPAGNTNAPKPGSFSFGPTSGAAPASTAAAGGEQKKDEAAGAGAASGAGGSLFSRLGGQTNAGEAPKTQAGSGQPMFSFPGAAKSEGGGASTQPANPFGAAAASNAAGSSAGAGGATSAPKFSFNIPKSSTPTPSTSNPGAGAPNNAAASKPTSAFPSSSLSGALGAGTSGEAQKTTTNAGGPMFNFKPPATPSSGAGTTPTAGTTGTNSTTPVAAPKFSFGQTGGSAAQSPFGQAAAQQQQQGQAQQAQGKEGEKKPIFGSGGGFGGTGSSGSNPFGSTSTTSTPSAFGSATSNTGSNPNPFGGATSGSTPSAFGATSAFGNANANSSSNSTPAFGNSNAASPFGNTNATSAFGNTNSNSTSAFGNTTGASAFGGNKTPAFGSGSGSTGSPFGATPAQTSNIFGGGSTSTTTDNKPATPAAGGETKPTFGGFGTQSNGTTSTPATNNGINTTTPKFSFGITSTPSTTPAPASSNNPLGGAAGGGSTTPAGTPAAASSGGGFAFNFNQQQKSGGATNGFGVTGTTTPQGSPFGAAAAGGPSIFGGGGSATNGTGTNGTNTNTNVFGGGVFGAAAPKAS
ncbi:hypothetical protein CVT26_012290 [Gymnopilus dilepis]|uniref:Uncharacterized protein n=1 Tax=Gymnopilus dilepis TaxID=231916 RepID=A0A409YQC6_9AGAR|nr:hypothetical protein CVT26_012290 [Gymnopilus dilepis]